MRKAQLVFAAAILAGCATTENLPHVLAVAETAPVRSSDDAADDPAIWVNKDAPEESLILGTDKQAGLHVYAFDGQEIQFIPSGAVNNVDLRQNVQIGGWQGDIAVASNRGTNSITTYEINDGAVEEGPSYPTTQTEPYGICAGVADGAFIAFVTYKSGDIVAHRFTDPGNVELSGAHKFETQLEGCVFHDKTGTIYIGEENRGVWKAAYSNGAFSEPVLIDEIGGASGVAADVEGLAIYHGRMRSFLIASSQGNNSFAVYDLATDDFIGRFAVTSGQTIDGAEETDGIEATGASLGAAFPHGAFVVQDGFNKAPDEPQNFKIIDWRDVERALQLN